MTARMMSNRSKAVDSIFGTTWIEAFSIQATVLCWTVLFTLVIGVLTSTRVAIELAPLVAVVVFALRLASGFQLPIFTSWLRDLPVNRYDASPAGNWTEMTKELSETVFRASEEQGTKRTGTEEAWFLINIPGSPTPGRFNIRFDSRRSFFNEELEEQTSDFAVGRDEKESDIVLDDRSVHRKPPLTLTISESGKVMAKVNGKPTGIIYVVSQGSGETTILNQGLFPLSHGDTIQIGAVSMEFSEHKAKEQ